MSKRLDERKPTELRVLTCSDNLSKYVLAMCVDSNYFPTKYRYTITRKLSEAVMDTRIFIKSANDIKVQTFLDYEKRRKFQNQAYAKIGEVITLMELANVMFPNVSKHKLEVTINLADETRSKLYAWMKSDKSKYKDIINSGTK